MPSTSPITNPMLDPTFQDFGASEDATFLGRIGIPSVLFWGFIGLLLFMIGDGVETGFLSPYLQDHGLSEHAVSGIFTAYGIFVGIAGWLSGALSDILGPRKVIMLGLSIWLVMEALFLTVGISHMSLPIILLTYGIRGLGYPLFAFGFLVWITVAAPRKRMASAMGWFWFAFTGGLPTLGSLLASFTIPRIGFLQTLWLSAGLVLLGGLVLLLGVKEPCGRQRLVAATENPIRTLFYSISIAWKKPKVFIAAIVRAINTAPEFGFFIFLPTFFIHEIGFPLQTWLRLLSAIFLSNIIWNLLFGLIGDKFGWRKTVAWCGGFGCTLSTLALYYLPREHHSLPLAIVVGALYGCTLAGYVPLSALTPALAPDHKGASLAMLSLGAGAAQMLGPAIVYMLLKPIGVAGVMWVFAGLYLLSGILALTLTTGQPQGEEV